MPRAKKKQSHASESFRIGRVRAYLRGHVWYLSYTEHGRRRQPRVGQCKKVAKQRAAEINHQLESGAPSAFGFEPIAIAELQKRWLDEHEHVRRSSLGTIRRYRAATQHLLDYVAQTRCLSRVSHFTPRHAVEFVRYLRGLTVAPNGHAHAAKRRLREGGIKYIPETSCSLFHGLGKLSPIRPQTASLAS